MLTIGPFLYRYRLLGHEFHNLSKEQKRLVMYAAQGGECWYCGCPMELYQPPGPIPDNLVSVEHITPMLYRSRASKAKAQLNKPFNRILVCHRCNNRRGSRPLTSFIGELRESGFTRGIVARIRHLVDDHRPAPWRAEAFEWYMIQAMAHPRRPVDSLKRLPASLEAAVLPDPSDPVPFWQILAEYQPLPAPQPKRRAPPLVTRFFRTLWRFTQGVRQLPHRKEGACR